jgi:hypothetical protein
MTQCAAYYRRHQTALVVMTQWAVPEGYHGTAVHSLSFIADLIRNVFWPLFKREVS